MRKTFLMLVLGMVVSSAACGDDSSPADIGHDDALGEDGAADADADGNADADADADADDSGEEGTETAADADADADADAVADDGGGEAGTWTTGVLCGATVECEPGFDCCVSGGATCIAEGSTCAGTYYTCDGAEDCTGSCCLTLEGSGCQTTCDIATLCHVDDDCGSGAHCCALAPSPDIRYRICMAPPCPGG